MFTFTTSPDGTLVLYVESADVSLGSAAATVLDYERDDIMRYARVFSDYARYEDWQDFIGWGTVQLSADPAMRREVVIGLTPSREVYVRLGLARCYLSSALEGMVS